jgi:hypothetical protein
MKLIALTLAALFALTACPDDKKKTDDGVNAPSGSGDKPAAEKKHGW